MRLRNRKVWVALLGCVVAGGTTGIVASGVSGGNGQPGLEPAAVEAALATGVPVRVASFAAAPGKQSRAVFLRETSDGLLCLWDAPDAGSHGPGGCNRATDPFAGQKMMISMAWDGGPALSTISDARLIGIVAADVEGLLLAMSDGTSRRVALQGSQTAIRAAGLYRAFAYRIRQSDLRAGIEPVAVVALDGNGQAIDRQATGLN
jgi:hypothetical protein